ncbi:MAG: hypothetical protein J6N76_06575, partial [Lachnospiraceae bacterium]|nr:hypothetical protein [Lachnospiraceae bacterium]
TECRKKAILILEKAADGFSVAIDMLDNYDNNKREEIRLLEEEVDGMVEACNSFLIRLSEKNVTPKESRIIADILHDLGDMERISDYSLVLSGTVKKIHKDGIKQKKELLETIAPVNTELKSILSSLKEAYENKDSVLAEEMLSKSGKLVAMIKKIKKSNLRMLRDRKVEAEGSVYLSDYLTISRRVAEHSANIAESLM